MFHVTQRRGELMYYLNSIFSAEINKEMSI